jgi:hypothetical protein
LSGPEIVGDVLIGLRFLRGFPGFLRHPIDPPRAREILEGRFRERAAGFLTVVREGAYRRPGSPYHRLLAAAGCEYGDLERLVRQDGVDGALERLLRDGVYVTLDEFKGRRPIVRGIDDLHHRPDAVSQPDVRGARGVPLRGKPRQGDPDPLRLRLHTGSQRQHLRDPERARRARLDASVLGRSGKRRDDPRA